MYERKPVLRHPPGLIGAQMVPSIFLHVMCIAQQHNTAYVEFNCILLYTLNHGQEVHHHLSSDCYYLVLVACHDIPLCTRKFYLWAHGELHQISIYCIFEGQIHCEFSLMEQPICLMNLLFIDFVHFYNSVMAVTLIQDCMEKLIFFLCSPNRNLIEGQLSAFSKA